MNKRKYFSMIIFTIFSVIFSPQLHIYVGRTELGYSSAHIYEKKVLKTQILNIILYYLTKWIVQSCHYAHCWMLNEWGNLQLHWGCWQLNTRRKYKRQENFSEFVSNKYVQIWVLDSSSAGFPGGSDGKASACNAGDRGSIPGWGRSPGEGNGNPLQYSCLENSMDWEASQSLVGYSSWGPKSRTRLRDFTSLH